MHIVPPNGSDGAVRGQIGMADQQPWRPSLRLGNGISDLQARAFP